MLIYKRYIIKNILPSLVTIIVSLTAIVWITQILKFLTLMDKGIKISHFLNLITLILPYLLFILLPFATLISIIYTYIHLSERRYFIVLQNLGLNNLQIASPALLVSLITTLLSYYITFSLLPLSYSKLMSDLNFIKNTCISTMLEEKIFNTIGNDITVYFNNKLPNKTMKGLIILDNRQADKKAVLFAKSGNIRSYNNISIFQLNNGIRQIHDHNNNLTNLSFDSLTIELANPTSPDLTLPSDNRKVNEYYVTELLNPSPDLSMQRQTKLIAAGHQRIIWPLYNFVLVFLALSVFLQQTYNNKSNLKQILVTIFFIVIVTYLHFACQNAAVENLMFIIGCYSNIIITLIISIILYFRHGDNKAHQ